MFLAEKEGASTPRSVQMRISYLTKALDAVAVAMSRVYDNPVNSATYLFCNVIYKVLLIQVLKKRLCKQQEELKGHLEDAKACPGL